MLKARIEGKNMFQDAYVRLGGEEANAVLRTINPLLEGTKLSNDGTIILATPTPFYAGYRYLDITDHSALPSKRVFAVYKAGDCVLMDWTNGPIYALNQRAPLKIIKQNVTSYVRFFFRHVRGRHGRFMIVETVDDISWRDDPSPSTRAAVAKMILPLTIVKNTGPVFEISARMVFQDSLFSATVIVEETGVITVRDEALLIEDMPVLEDTFGQ